MKKTEGFITKDGTFFESEMEAILHEAEAELRTRLDMVGPELHVDQDRFLALVFEVRSQLWSYLNAYTAASTPKPDKQAEEPNRAEAVDGRKATLDGSIGHVSSTEEDLTSLLKLPSRGLSPVPDVGSSPRSKKIPERRAKHGA